MKVINLMNMIALGEEVPKKIIYDEEIYKLREDLNDYENTFYSGDEIWKFKYLFEDPYGKDYKEFFNEEIEVMEEDKKIEELELKYYHDQPALIEDLAYTVNQIIKYINEEL